MASGPPSPGTATLRSPSPADLSAASFPADPKCFFDCASCGELLFEPLTLPCGNSVCRPCLRLPKLSEPAAALKTQLFATVPDLLEPGTDHDRAASAVTACLVTYVCPAKCCRRRHQHRSDRINCTLAAIIDKLFPLHISALKHVKAAEELVAKAAALATTVPEQTDEVSVAQQLERQDDSKLLHGKALVEIDAATTLVSDLQSPYIVRAKILCAQGRFSEAISSAQTASALNPKNRRGIVTQRLIELRYRKQIGEPDDTSSGPGVSELIRATAETTQSSKHSTEEKAWRNVDPTILSDLQAELECNLCMNLMMSPITSPCGHSWCRACALRSLDHSRRCPLCRTIMPGVGYALRRPVTKALENLCQLQISKPAHPAEIPSVEKPFEIAVFVCSLAFPESSPSFHIFEPRYRVMIEECLRGSRRFGICLPERSLFTPASYVSCGTVLEITHSEAVDDDKVMTSLGVLPRYIVNTSAVHRFQVLSRRQTAEGLDYATVVRIEDVDGEDVGFEKPGSWDPISLASNLLRTRSFLIALLESLPSHVKTMFLSQNKPIPSDPAAFTFWLANILPLHPYQKYELLPMTSVAERLEKLVAWISLIAPNRSPSRDSD